MSKTRIDYTDPMFLLEVEGLARDGFDDCQIAELLDISPEHFNRQKRKKQPDGSKSQLYQSVLRGRRPLAVLVENSMYKLAVGGHKYKTTVTRWLLGPDGKQTDIEVVQETETELPPNQAAAAFWLKHHKPDVYNIQPERVDVTTKGKELNEPPRIAKIEHVTISSDHIKKQDLEV